MNDTLDSLLGNDALLLTAAGGVVLVLAILIIVLRKVRKTNAGKIADKLTGPVMFGGMLWSADAVWIITGSDYLDLPTPLRVAMFAVLEFMLLVAMLRAKDSMDRVKHTGRHGQTVWLIASLIALFGFVLGMYEGGIVVAAFRPIVPLMLTKLWSDGVLGDGSRKAGAFKWTPRNLLIAMGAIEADDRDVRDVNRARLVQRMVECDRKRASATDGSTRKTRLEGKLIRLSEKADPEIIAEVRRKRALSNWWSVTQLKMRPLTQDDALADAGRDALADAAVTQHGDARMTQVAIAPNRRAKSMTQVVTSDDARDADPATRAAQLVMTQGLSNREAARRVPGATDPTVRRRVKELRGAASDAPDDAPEQVNGHPVLTHSEN